ncbi:MAG TPA: cbb3-type cytochrome oxidase assembly protein CcoS [Ignavibacteria bacterium]
MTAVIVLISASIIVATVFLLAFLWAVKSGQYDDRYTPSVRMLFDNETENKKDEEKNNK